ncbi:MAG: MFS transporter [Bacteroidetes bacterium HGW-Bacteroidetes-19]|nr:MAG: MFS transporter [Bacteroidetes bacterium HGW-Bacteroidetes-19]
MKIQKTNSGKNSNRSILLLATMSSHFLNPFMGSAVNIALKQIGTDFSMSAVGLSWVTMSYLLSGAVFLVPFGKIGDMIGRRKIFLFGTLLFAITTLLCGFSTDASSLIIFRLLQGISSAMMISTNMALIISAFPPEERGKVIGLNVTSVYVGSSVAPVIGGLLTDALGWRSIFYINGIAALCIAWLIIWKIQKEMPNPIKERFDFKGSLIYMLSISALMYGFSKLPSPHAIALTIAGVLGLLLFMRSQLKTETPMLNMRLFSQNRVFALSNLSALINYAATFAISFMLSLYLQYAKGMEAREAGMILIAQPTLMAIMASFSGRLSDKMNPRILAALGMGISTIGLFILSFISQETSIGYIIFGLIVLGFGFGLFSSPNTNVVMSSVDKKIYGTASAILATMRSTGMMFSMAIAALSMHLFLGNAKINIQNVPDFISSTKVVFVIFTLLCFVGVFLSLMKKKTTVHS